MTEINQTAGIIEPQPPMMPIAAPIATFEFSTDVAEDRKEMFSDFIKAWGATGTPVQNKTVEVRKDGKKLYEFSYTDLAGILDAARPNFAANNLAISQQAFTKKMPNGTEEIQVYTFFLHASGHFMRTRPLTALSSRNMQDLGGTITYLKRYSLAAALGLATEADNDAAATQGHEIVDKTNKGKQTNNNKTAADNEKNIRNSEPAESATKMASDAQKKKIHAMCKNIGKLQGYDQAKVYPIIQHMFKTDVAIEDLGSKAASGLIGVLGQFDIEDETKRRRLEPPADKPLDEGSK